MPDEPSLHELELQRRKNRDAIRDLGADPYGHRVDGLLALADARLLYNEKADADHQANSKNEGFRDTRPVVRVAGRVVLHRDNGKLVWMQLRDHTTGSEGSTDLQIAVSKRDCAERGFNIAKLLDLGDIVVATGPLMKTKAGEVTIWASDLDIACKSLALPPEKRAGLQDPEQRYRKRYVDLYTNPETMRVFQLRSLLVSRLRRFWDERGFLEVDTPVLQTLAGGAAARPFTTHLNALDIPLFLRIAPELYLKRLLVGGMPRVYEVARNFRNEGMDRSHNPEFSMVEVYEAFGNYERMMDLTEALVRDLARVAAEFRTGMQGEGSPSNTDNPPDLRLPFDTITIDYSRPFARVTYGELFQRAYGFPMSDEAKVRAQAKAQHVPNADKLAHELLINALFDKAEESIDPTVPTFVMDYPAPLCPLTRPKASDPSIAERFELFIGGMECANAYTELNDPDIQEQKFREQLAGIDDEESTFRTYDADFVEALKVGMPPAGGLGVGVDRLVMLLTNNRSIRDVLLFPMMRPLPSEQGL
ncbi:MAG: lysine--tRNA ligase [Phycisphaeraceae bacterium]|nr:lysine--tRNA ligase [Phycisphaeraceae bacterium]